MTRPQRAPGPMVALAVLVTGCASLGGLTGGDADGGAREAGSSHDTGTTRDAPASKDAPSDRSVGSAHDAHIDAGHTDATPRDASGAETSTPDTGVDGAVPPISCVNSSAHDVTLESSITVQLPAGAEQGDLLLALLSSDDDNGTASPPSGWASVTYEGDSISGSQVWLYSRAVAASEPAMETFTVTQAADLSLVVTAYRNVAAPPAEFDVSPVAQSPLTGDNDGGVETFTAPSVTTTVANAMALFMFFDSQGSGPEPAAGLQRCGTGYEASFLTTGYFIQASPGATGSFTAADLSPPSTRYITITAALEPR